MLALRLLGGLTLENPDRITLGRAAQRRRLALLAVLASPVGAPIARERLIGLLWPDIAPEDARHRLSVALYDLRQVLGDDAISMSSRSVTLRPGAIALDVAEFEAAVAREDWEAAAAAYAGPFLDAVYLFDSPGFEEWVEARRTTLKRTAARALELIANARNRRGDRDGTLEAWRRLSEIDPYSGRFAAGHMRALDAAGDRAGALRHAAEHSERLRVDLDAETTSEVQQLATELKRAPTPHAVAAHSSLGATSSSAVPGHARPLVADSDGSEAPRRILRRTLTAGAMLIVLVLLTPAARMLSSRAQQTARARTMNQSAATRSRALRDGEAHMRSGRFDQAVTIFERAVADDSAFALGHFRLAVATLWADQPNSNLDAPLERALAFRNELDELNKILLDGFVAWRRGSWNHAELVYRRALTIDTASIEARHQLGETLFHYNTPQGRSVDESRAEFERVVALDPRHFGALWHLAQLAARGGRDADVVVLSNRLLALEPDPVRRLEVEVLRAAALNDKSEIDRVMQRLRDADESLLFGTGWRLAIFARNLDAAERVFTLLTDPRRGPYTRSLGHTQLFHVAIAGGRRRDAEAQLRALSELRDAGVQAEELALLLAAAPGEPMQEQALRRARDVYAQRVALPRASVSEGSAAFRVVGTHATLGRSYALLGDSVNAVAIATQLERGLPLVSRDSVTRAVSTGRAAAIRALQARHAGRPEDVIRWVDHSLTRRWFSNGLVDSHMSYSLERYLRGEALMALGRAHEADSWFATIGQHDLPDLVFLRAALLRRAELAEKRGDKASATRFRGEMQQLSFRASPSGRAEESPSSR